MKPFKILPVAIVLVLMVAAVGCTTMRETGRDDGYYERTSSAPARVYVDDPYRGTAVLERDPYTGRYYEVNSYGSYYGMRSQGYDPYYDRRYSDRRYNNDRRYNYPGNTRTVRTPREVPPPKQPTREAIRQQQQNKEDARKKVLGN